MNRLVMELPICPRCMGFIPNNDAPGEYIGALSRADNETEVCSPCGHEEALIDFANGEYRNGTAHDMSRWPVSSDRARVTRGLIERAKQKVFETKAAGKESRR